MCSGRFKNKPKHSVYLEQRIRDRRCERIYTRFRFVFVQACACFVCVRVFLVSVCAFARRIDASSSSSHRHTTDHRQPAYSTWTHFTARIFRTKRVFVSESASCVNCHQTQMKPTVASNSNSNRMPQPTNCQYTTRYCCKCSMRRRILPKKTN